MSLFSDVDWVILVAVVAFFFIGKRNEQLLRQIGRYYGRLVRLKNEAFAEVNAAAGLPMPIVGGGAASVRQFLMSDAFGSSVAGSSGIPTAVTSPPAVVVRHTVELYPYAQNHGQWTWSLGAPVTSLESTEVR